MSDRVIVEIDQGVADVRLNRPEMGAGAYFEKRDPAFTDPSSG